MPSITQLSPPTGVTADRSPNDIARRVCISHDIAALIDMHGLPMSAEGCISRAREHLDRAAFHIHTQDRLDLRADVLAAAAVLQGLVERLDREDAR